MKLLIITQKIDQDDSILGFFHRWVEEFSKYCSQATVIALGVGKYNLPDNVKILSLGKEKNISRFKYLINFYKYIWSERKNYDAVFVHMNQEYIILGSLIWKILSKKITMWRNHPTGNLFTYLAMMLSDHIFCTSKYSFTMKSKKTKLMPSGIDTELFKRNPSVTKIKNSVLYIGRIAPVKNIDILIDAVFLIDKLGYDIFVSIIGDALSNDMQYMSEIKNLAQPLINKGKINFLGSVPNDKTPFVYNKYEIVVNLTDSGSFDKTVLESMACENLVVLSNKSFVGVIPNQFIFEKRNKKDLSDKIIKILFLENSEKIRIARKLREFVDEKHTLHLLAKELFLFL